MLGKSENFDKNEHFQEFKSNRKKDNICSKPFRPTCNRDKIFSSLRYLEDKIDELEYRIYRKHMEKQKKAMNAEGHKRAKNIQDLALKDKIKTQRHFAQQAKKARALENQKTVIQAKNQKERKKLQEKLLKDQTVKKPPKLPSFSSQASNSPILGQAKAGINKGKNEIDKELSGKKNKKKRESVKDDIKDAQTKIDTPSGFVL